MTLLSPSATLSIFRERLHRQERELALRPTKRQSLPVTVCVLLASVVLVMSRVHVVELQADELLKRALAVEADEEAWTTQKLRVQLTADTSVGAPQAPFVLIRRSSRSPGPAIESGTVLPAIWETALAGTSFDKHRLLRVANFESWRRQRGVRTVR